MVKTILNLFKKRSNQVRYTKHLKYPFTAVWKNQSYDFDVNIVGYAGEMNGEHYFYREASQTGIPSSQLFYN